MNSASQRWVSLEAMDVPRVDPSGGRYSRNLGLAAPPVHAWLTKMDDEDMSYGVRNSSVYEQKGNVAR